MPDEADRSLGEQVLSSLLQVSHKLRPADLAAEVAARGEVLGLTDVVIYLVDHDQRLLVPLLGEGVPEREPLGVDSTLAGRTFRTERILAGHISPDDVGDVDLADGLGPGGSRLWVPLLDGAERVGVLAVTAPGTDDLLLRRCRDFATLVAELIVSKSMYGDDLLVVRRRREMTLAAEMRWQVLPPLSYTDEEVSVAGILEPAYEIAGDSFDYAINGGCTDVAIFDAVGHGLEASRIATLAVVAYRHARRRKAGIAEIVKSLDTVVAGQFGTEKFVTGQLARLDTSEGTLTWANAGHPLPILLRGSSSTIDMRADACLPLGLGPFQVELLETSLEPGDAVLFFTDGVTEARSPEGEEFGRERLGELLVRAAAAGQTPAETMRRLVHAVLDHQQGQLQDDATLLMLVWHGGSRI